MPRLQLQFQAGEPEPIDEESNDRKSETVSEAELNRTLAIDRPIFASISSKNVAQSDSKTFNSECDSNPESTQILNHWYSWILDLQKLYGEEAVSIVNGEDGLEYYEDNDDSIFNINSLVFSLTEPIELNELNNSRVYVLVVIESNCRVDISALQSVLVTNQALFPDLASKIQLAPSHQVKSLCGFAPGCVPPMIPSLVTKDFSISPPLITIIDESLLRAVPPEEITLIGGGGELDQICRVAMDVLLHQPRTIVAAVAQKKAEDESWTKDSPSSKKSISSILKESSISPRFLPYFAIAVPEGLSGVDVEQRFTLAAQEEVVSFVGRVGSVRRMARTLTFCDLLPPDIILSEEEGSNVDVLFPWLNPATGLAMAVQLILGQTLLRTTGTDEAIRQIHPGELLLVQGRTNFRSVNSLRNWIRNNTLDIVVQSYHRLLPASLLEQQSNNLQKKTVQRKPSSTRPPLSIAPTAESIEYCLRLTDVYDVSDPSEVEDDVAVYKNLSHSFLVNGEAKDSSRIDPDPVPSNVVIVNDLLTVKQFTKELSLLLQSRGHSSTIGLVGIDCEWQPTFLLSNSRDPQPVLLLQVSLHSLKRVYLFDLQTLLRPMMPASQSMDMLEREVSTALGALFESKRLMKVGFHIVNDLRQLSASYPHISSLHFYNAVLEVSTLAKKEIRQTQSGNAREATSSLSRLVAHYLGKPLNKNEQCSDWSSRPLSRPQIEYSALDAAVTPIIAEKVISNLNVRFFGEKPYLGRWENDVSLKTSISSLRFVFVHTSDPTVQVKLKAKRVVGDALIVSQSWITGDLPPKVPVLPETSSDGIYTDINGVVQIPSVSVSVRSAHLDEVIDRMIGRFAGSSKDMCLSNFLHRQVKFSEGAKLEYPHRSGFVEFSDGVVLFVNMQCSPGNRFKSKSYPNEWLNNGQILTWFLRENDWQRGETRLAKKLLSSPNSVFVTLFVRFGRVGEFICCGRCQVEECCELDRINGDREEDSLSENWALVKLHLLLLDWKMLQSSVNFQAMLNSVPDDETS